MVLPGRHPAAAVLRARTLASPVNLGGIGMVIGHELTHGFDDEGAQFDADGNLEDWWTEDDKAKFEAQDASASPTVRALRGPAEAVQVNGKLTLGENIADLGGVKLAFRAYRALREERPEGDRRRRLHRGSAVLPRVGPGVVQQGPPEVERSVG